MKLLTEYLERAIQLEKMAAEESDSEFKRDLLKQAGAYRNLQRNGPRYTASRLQARQSRRIWINSGLNG
ncbi:MULTISPECIES: hypothetical protein [unclassified Bradyrhizobium]|jgi:hypothetical protein|uniref:hypothetical protein n=1 Tax=unclassified Bradyrhizobium TaxID=2631580 RepID=UPI001FF7C0C6|nr:MULTISPECIES: hypothetical protein [unclassified Bradyrhizobium]